MFKMLKKNHIVSVAFVFSFYTKLSSIIC